MVDLFGSDAALRSILLSATMEACLSCNTSHERLIADASRYRQVAVIIELFGNQAAGWPRPHYGGQRCEGSPTSIARSGVIAPRPAPHAQWVGWFYKPIMAASTTMTGNMRTQQAMKAATPTNPCSPA